MTNSITYNFQLLGNAVVEQAANDYRTALCEEHQAWITGREYEAKKWGDEIKALEKFFCGEGIMAFSDINGPVLMKRLYAEVKKFKYDIHVLRKELQRKRQILYNMGAIE